MSMQVVVNLRVAGCLEHRNILLITVTTSSGNNRDGSIIERILKIFEKIGNSNYSREEGILDISNGTPINGENISAEFSYAFHLAHDAL